MDQYAVMGNPIEHSLSPRIHKAFATQTGERMQYRAFLVPEHSFANAVRDFVKADGCGMNVTIPFKQEAFELADTLSERAQLAGAVNTLTVGDDGTLSGDNTDGAGLVQDLGDSHGLALAGQRLLVVGAGGAVRGVLGPLLDAGPKELVIANRTAEKAERLAEAFQSHGSVRGCGFEALAGERFDGIVNGSAASLEGEAPPLPDALIADGGWCYDMMYARETTPFNAWAQAQGAARTLDGLGMLVGQAAESFYIWRGVRPAVAPVIQQLRSL